MTKFTCHRCLLYTILALLHSVGQCAMAQDAHEEEPRFVYDIDNVNFFDNREVHSPYQVSQTLFASRLDAEIGIQFDANSIMVGIMAVKDFGQSGTAKQELNFYYHYEERNFSGAFGAFPRKRLKQELPNIFVYDSIRYYSPTIYGALIQYTTNFGYAEFYCNWLNKQGKGQREIFELITDGRFGHKGYYLGWNIQLTHFSVPRPSNGLHVYDKLMIYPHVGIERSPSSMIDAISLEAGCLLSLNRDRSDMLWHSPIGFLGEVKLRKGRFEICDYLYAGNPQFTHYEVHGASLHRGDPYYRSPLYNRTDVRFYLLNRQNVQCYAGASLHYTEGTLDNSQQVVLRVFPKF